MISFGSNISALQAQRRLAESSSAVSKSFQRLSSGKRINSAGDDAAGLAIADGLRNRANLFAGAMRNINDGLSALNIASGTLSEQSNVLQRLMELAEQSANGTFTTAQRQTLGVEYKALVREAGRLGDSASFNGLSLLLANRGATTASLQLQVGVNGQASSQITSQGVDTGSFSGNFDLSISGSGYGPSQTIDRLATLYSNQLLAVTITDSSGQSRDLLIGFTSDIFTATSVIFNVDIYQRVSDTGGVGAVTGLAQAVTDAAHDWIYGGTSTIDVSASTGRLLNSSTLTASLGFQNNTVAGSLNLDLSGMRFSGVSGYSVSSAAAQTTSLEGSGIENASRAREAIKVLQARLNELGTYQGNIGAAQSRLQVALSLASVNNEGTSSAESRIRDIDVASESALLTAASIRQQSAIAVLSQANSQPQLLLSLLR
ncbi:MAG: hypothetical protein J0M12_05535 [Deltaproteobacteria bacterium]|nr:hypothetical protein [Deltaproteobacteria bacterium]